MSIRGVQMKIDAENRQLEDTRTAPDYPRHADEVMTKDTVTPRPPSSSSFVAMDAITQSRNLVKCATAHVYARQPAGDFSNTDVNQSTVDDRCRCVRSRS
jgi:hypothetical protein